MSTYFVKWSMGLWTILPCKVTGVHCFWNDTSLLPYALLATLHEIAQKYSELLQDMFPAN